MSYPDEDTFDSIKLTDVMRCYGVNSYITVITQVIQWGQHFLFYSEYTSDIVMMKPLVYNDDK